MWHEGGHTRVGSIFQYLIQHLQAIVVMTAANAACCMHDSHLTTSIAISIKSLTMVSNLHIEDDHNETNAFDLMISIHNMTRYN